MIEKLKRPIILLVFFVVIFFTSQFATAFADSSSGSWGRNLTWTLSGSTLTISGSGEMKEESYFCYPWFDSRDSITKIQISSGVTSIGGYAFFEYPSITEVSIE